MPAFSTGHCRWEASHDPFIGDKILIPSEMLPIGIVDILELEFMVSGS